MAGREQKSLKQGAEVALFDYGKSIGDSQIRLRAALGFCNPYKLAMSNLGFQWVHRLLNLEPQVYCDRFYLPDDVGPGKAAKPLLTFENQVPLSRFDLLGFSIPFEMDYLNLPSMLRMGGVEPFAARRAERGGPVVIAGGVAVSSNPEPLADFIDVFFVGECEKTLPAFMEAFRNVQATSGLKPYQPGFRERLFEAVRGIDGIYIPSGYEIEYNADGTLSRHSPKPGFPDAVSNILESDLNPAAHSSFLTDETIFGKMFLMELSRGCPYGCKFCWTRFASRKFRASKLETMEDVIDFGLKRSKRIGLIGVSFFNVQQLETVLRRIYEGGGEVSFSSIRFTRKVMDIFLKLNHYLKMESIAIAPEAAVERLQKVVNKEFETGIEENLCKLDLPDLRRVKMYFLSGIPGETVADAEAIGRMGIRIAENMKNRRATVGISVNPLIPKPSTPFQWLAYPERADLEQKFAAVRESVKKAKRVEAKTKSIKEGLAQTILACGDRRLSAALAELPPGASTSVFLQTLKRTGLSAEFYARARGRHELFPWDIVGRRVGRDRLWQEYRDALEAGEAAAIAGA